ncbi:MAG: type III secretion system inner rod subunit SctI [Ramlibacter sp.]
MSELATIATKLAASSGPTQAVAAPMLPPDDLAAARFSAIMQPAQAAPAQVATEMVVAPAADGMAMAKTGSLGDKVLTGMQNLSAEFKQSFDWIRGALDGHLTTNDMLKLQMGITQTSLKYDLVGKAISRSTQNVDQLVKMQ